MIRLVVRVLVLSVLCFSLVGCFERELIGNLEAREAMEVYAALRRSGISAQKAKEAKGRKERFSIQVHPDDFPRATEVLLQFDLPSSANDKINILVGQKSLFPGSKDLTYLRGDYVRSLQVERVIRALPNVAGVKAVVQTVQKRRVLGRDSSKEARAAVVIRYYEQDGVAPIDKEGVTKLVQQSVPGLSAENVRVHFSPLSIKLKGENQELVPLSAVAPFMFEVPKDTKSRAQRQVLVILAFFCFCGVVLGFFIGGWRTRKAYAQVQPLPDAASSKRVFVEASVSTEGTQNKQRRLTSE